MNGVNPLKRATRRKTPSRRVFIQRALSLAGLGALSAVENACASSTPARLRYRRLPHVDGQWLVDEATRTAVATDWGREVQRLPFAVLRPASTADIVRAVNYATDAGLKIGMRGGGHCVSGQAQVSDGILIDSSTLNAVRWHETRLLDAEPGASCGDVARVALSRGLTPPVLPDALMLTIGGLTSVGGTGEMSHRLGALVDHVRELDVVTGRGELVTCSANANEELFRMMLAGLGQCGIIVRARLSLEPAPSYVEVHRLSYDTVESVLQDLTQLANAEGTAMLAGEITPTPARGWRIALLACSFVPRPNVDVTPSWIHGLRFRVREPRLTRDYFAHLDRRTASISAAKRSGSPNPALVVVLPENTTLPFITDVLSSPEASLGIWRIEVLPLIRSRLAQPLHVIPAADRAFTVRLQRRASGRGAADHTAMLSANRALLREARAAGGKVYPPVGPSLAPEEWREHYGAATWQRLVAAKKQFDPANALTPGPGLFS